MATVSWRASNGKETLKHIEGFGETLCGLDIPPHPHNRTWSFFGTPTCKRCIKIKHKEESK